MATRPVRIRHPFAPRSAQAEQPPSITGCESPVMAAQMHSPEPTPVLPEHHLHFATAAAVFFATIARIHAEQSRQRVLRHIERTRGHLKAAETLSVPRVA